VASHFRGPWAFGNYSPSPNAQAASTNLQTFNISSGSLMLLTNSVRRVEQGATDVPLVVCEISKVPT
jgi:hypothetical protein